MSGGPESFSYHFSRNLAEQALAETKPEPLPEAGFVTNVFQLNLHEATASSLKRAPKRAAGYWAQTQSEAYTRNLPAAAPETPTPSQTTFNRAF
ncbi:MAG: hypothetical protein PW734_09595 [Verrucomicrobium sp.]|nr:hypothetical protein [Verrucomicrobium sp.]